MCLKLEYLGEFEFIFENNFVHESGDQVSTFDEKTRCQKSHASVSLNMIIIKK
jgi:hypothetical protein